MARMKVRAFLADSVQSVEGKLYVLGAGWNRLAAGGFPARHDRVGIGVLLTIEDGKSAEHNVELSLLDEREQPVALFTDPAGTEQFAINASFQTDAPADGFGDVCVPFALNIDGIVFPAPGTYAVTIRVDGQDQERLPFRVDLAGGASGADGNPGGTTTGRAGDAGYL
jgi:hypothetical protein